MEQSPSRDDNKPSANQEIRHILRNPKFHYPIHKCPPLDLSKKQISPVYASPSHSLKIHFSIILRSTPSYSKWSISLRSPYPIPICTSSLPHVPLGPTSSSFLIWSPEYYLVKGTDHKASRYVLIKLIITIYKFILAKEL